MRVIEERREGVECGDDFWSLLDGDGERFRECEGYLRALNDGGDHGA